MVRLMHSMVRMNLLRQRSWDVACYGIPIPQVDQMPAGTMPAVRHGVPRRAGEARLLAARARGGRALSAPVLLAGSARRSAARDAAGHLRFDARVHATLRDGYDDATNGALVRATMAAYLPESHELPGRIHNALERSISKVFFRHTFRVPTEKVRQMGIIPSPLDYAIFAAFQAYVWPTLFAHMAAERIPVRGGRMQTVCSCGASTRCS
jgi:hypothetical protein